MDLCMEVDLGEGEGGILDMSDETEMSLLA